MSSHASQEKVLMEETSKVVRHKEEVVGFIQMIGYLLVMNGASEIVTIQ